MTPNYKNQPQNSIPLPLLLALWITVESVLLVSTKLCCNKTRFITPGNVFTAPESSNAVLLHHSSCLRLLFHGNRFHEAQNAQVLCWRCLMRPGTLKWARLERIDDFCVLCTSVLIGPALCVCIVYHSVAELLLLDAFFFLKTALIVALGKFNLAGVLQPDSW